MKRLSQWTARIKVESTQQKEFRAQKQRCVEDHTNCYHNKKYEKIRKNKSIKKNSQVIENFNK